MLRRQKAFTLMEVLVASALVGLVLALAMRGFSEVTKVTNLSKSKLTVNEEAARGVQAAASLLKRATIVYYTARPLGVLNNNTQVTNAQSHNFGSNGQLAVPSYFANQSPLAGGGKTVFYGGSGKLADPSSAWGMAYRVPRNRFPIYDPGSTDYLSNAQRLMSNDPSYTGNDRFFPSPLAYWGEARFADYTTSSTIQNAALPIEWDFYLLYLAPMRLPADSAQLSYAGAGYRIDQVPNPPNPAWNRSTVPFELRLLHVPGVRANRTGFALRTDPADAARPAALRTNHILGVPFDYASGGVNYDPIPIPMSGDATTNLSAAEFLRSSYTYQNGAGTTSVLGSGARVNNGGVANRFHPNFNNLGNDPPSEDALTERDTTRRVTDRVLAQYIDPDSVDGTCVRLLNNIDPTPGTGVGAGYRRYLNAYVGDPSLGVGFLYNTYRNAFPGAGLAPEGDVPAPRRALLSVTTRYRNDRRLPFQFSTERLEVDLEGVVNYANQNRRMR